MPADTPAQDRETLTVADIETLSAKEAETGSRTEREIPADAIAIVPVRQLVSVPGHGDPGDASAGRVRSPQRRMPSAPSGRSASSPSATRPSTSRGEIDLHRIGTVANVVRYLTGTGRLRIISSPGRTALPGGRVPARLAVPRGARRAASRTPGRPTVAARSRPASSTSSARRSRRWSPAAGAGAIVAVEISAVGDARRARRYRSGLSGSDLEQKQEVLETIDLTARHRPGARAARLERIEVLRLSQEIGQQTQRRRSTSGSARCILREQMSAIQKELGEADEQGRARSPNSRGDHQGRDAEGGRGPGAARSCGGSSACPRRAPNTA